MDTIWIIGCGDIGLRVAQRLHQQGREATGVVRSAQSAERLRAAGVTAVRADLDSELPPLAGTVLWFAPPPRDGDSDPRVARFVSAAPPVTRFVYLSTSGVYGDCGGAWIDESAPLQPKSARARRRVDAEQRLGDWAAAGGVSLSVLRVPGIYGPGRLPEARLREGTPVLLPEEAPWTNRIHADDLAAAALAILDGGRGGGAYNVADGNPTTMTDYFCRCARLLGLPEPPALPASEARQGMSSAMWSFMEESKRLRVDRLREELAFDWRYPDLDSGLPACL
ncbi:SDR family oxidoreductase [Algiphilus aromaticivorans]|uniref:SDR family oxidoreductase n=1 Tax=Algiphilus aromaticivorans TaxID=382454 RepID=UPI0005C2350C|nr:SDR family oxidoreductase [Algiphilus aromaticivorans]